MYIQSATKQRNNWHLIRYAYHEAGHAVVGHVIGRCIAEVSIISDKQKGYRGYCAFDAFIEDANSYPQWQNGSNNPQLITIMYAGTVAMEMICQIRAWKYERWRRCDVADFDYIYEWCNKKLEDDKQRLAVQKACQEQAREILSRYWFVVDELAAILLMEGFLSGGEVHSIIRQAVGETGEDWRIDAL